MYTSCATQPVEQLNEWHAQNDMLPLNVHVNDRRERRKISAQLAWAIRLVRHTAQRRARTLRHSIYCLPCHVLVAQTDEGWNYVRNLNGAQ